jgi:DNA-binding MarR family transcriptional regulator
MEKKYAHVLELITLWQEFEEQHKPYTSHKKTALREFHLWLGSHLQQAEQAVSQLDNTTYSAEASAMLVSLSGNLADNNDTHSPAQNIRAVDGPYANMLGVDTRISVLIGRMWRFAKFYVKKALDSQAISTLDEFTFLATIKRAGTPTKTEVCVENITEITTGTEILRRMIKAGFVEEFPDTEDRRMKRLKLTPAGTQALFTSFAQLRDVARIVVGTLSEDQKTQLAGMLDDLDMFHTNIYADQRMSSIESMVEKNLAPA